MTCIRSLGPAACLLLGCQMANPAFEEGDSLGDDVGESSSRESSSEASDAPTSSSEANDDPSSSSDSSSSSDASSSEASDDPTTSSTDASSSENSDTEALPDLPAQMCLGSLGMPFAAVYGQAGQFGGACPPSATVTMKIVGPGPLPGLMIGTLCDEACSGGCNGAQYVFGVTGLADFADPLLEAAAQIKTCVHVETLGTLGADAESRCLFGSMWIAKGEEDRLVIGGAGPLTDSAALLLAGKLPPSFGDMQFGCPCDQLQLPENELDCCLGAGVDPFFASLDFQGVDLLPGEWGDVVLDSTTFRYHVAQAQQVATCANEMALPEVSWALVRKP